MSASKSTLLLACCISLFLARCLVAQTAAQPTTERWSVDDLILMEEASNLIISRDGRLAAWIKSTVTRVKGEEKRVSNLWLTRLDSPTSVQLTRGADKISAARFSPKGSHIAFVSSRALPADMTESDGGLEPHETQLWVIPTDGGEARPLTRLDREIKAFDWADEATIILAAAEMKSLWLQQRQEMKDTAIAVEDALREPPVRLFALSIEDGSLRRVTSNTDWISGMAIAPNGRWACVIAQQSLSYMFDNLVRPRLFIVDLATGERHEAFDPQTTNLVAETIHWSPDSGRVYFTNLRSSHPVYRMAGVLDIHEFDVARREVRKIELDWDRGLSADPPIPVEGGFIALLADGVRLRPAFYREHERRWTRRDLAGTHARNIYELAASFDGRRIVYNTSSCTTLPQCYVASLEGSQIVGEANITNLNPALAGRATGRVEIIQWPGARDEIVEGILSYPLDWTAGQKYPLVVLAHGGPAGASMDQWTSTWAEPFIMLRQRGAFTLEPNYHGSAYYGLEWVTSISDGNYYDLEIPDIQRGVEHLIEQGLVDEDRLGIAGWSNGGILAIDLITKDHRFKAASVGAADVEWISDWGNVDFGAAFDNFYFGGHPLEKTQVYLDKSPMLRLDRVTTPTIFHTGTEDRNVPPHQSWSAFRVMQQLSKAPARLVLYPGEGHWLEKTAHQRRKLEEDLAWFDAHLFGRSVDELQDALKRESLLATLIERAKAARHDENFGVLVHSVLVPETVRFKGMDVGRFEVTRAQFAAFDPTYPVPQGQANFPATDITYERAVEYAAWLTARTGREFRLPTAEEAKSLAAAAEQGSGNTLDRWAGYTANPLDVARVHQALARLDSSLLLEVGSLPGAKDHDEAETVFDLDGNASEWAGSGSGGVLVGPSADRPSKPMDDRIQPAPRYRGFRIVASPR